jgi:hypothetical protein
VLTKKNRQIKTKRLITGKMVICHSKIKQISSSFYMLPTGKKYNTKKKKGERERKKRKGKT